MSGYCPDCGNTLCICDYDVKVTYPLRVQIKDLENKLTTLQGQLKEAKEVIGFYGNIENWRNPKYPQKHDFNVLDSEDGRDVDEIKGGYFIAGKRARQYLEKYKDGK